jgi:hypothetical protein
MDKKYYIFTDANDAMLENLDTSVEDYINENFSEYTLILTENNESVIINEENDGYMVMEYDF